MLLKPTSRVHSVADISHEWLQSEGIHALMVDLDDTLVASGQGTIDVRFRHWLAQLKEAGIAITILSNGSQRRVSYWSKELDIPAFSLAGKPLYRAFQKAIRRLGTKKQETLMVGDQLFTDVLGSNLFGIRSVLVQPLSPGAMLHTRLARKLEAFVLKGQAHGRTLHR